MNKTLTVKQEQWNEGAAKWLARACDDEYTLDDLQRDCMQGPCALFNVYDDFREHIASFVLRIDEGSTREMVVVAAGGFLARGSLYKVITPYVMAQASANRCASLRGHTRSIGVGRLMEWAGWEQSEIIYRKQVGHGRQIIQ